MPETLELPTGETVTPEDVFLFEGYPYRYRPDDGDGFLLAPLYWGGGQLDVPFGSEADLAQRWETDDPDTRGLLGDDEWREWLTEARDDDRFGREELDAIERELDLVEGTFDRLRRRLGL